MNIRNIDNIDIDISKINLDSNDTIILRAEPYKIKSLEVKLLVERMKVLFPDNKVVFISGKKEDIDIYVTDNSNIREETMLW